ncbi:MAG TPA: DUF4124 domain-containing protein [Archangium sp.]
MKPLLLIALLAGQTFYEWVDASGQSHFTDDPASIPAGAKRRTTQGAEPMLVSTKSIDAGVSTAARDGGVKVAAPPKAAPAPSGPNKCEQAQQRIAELETRLAQVKDGASAEEQREAQRCQERLNQFGHGAYAQCMAARQQRPPKTASLEKDLEVAREELRRVQVGGCN